jgi:hypothetical protein
LSVFFVDGELPHTHSSPVSFRPVTEDSCIDFTPIKDPVLVVVPDDDSPPKPCDIRVLAFWFDGLSHMDEFVRPINVDLDSPIGSLRLCFPQAGTDDLRMFAWLTPPCRELDQSATFRAASVRAGEQIFVQRRADSYSYEQFFNDTCPDRISLTVADFDSPGSEMVFENIPAAQSPRSFKQQLAAAFGIEEYDPLHNSILFLRRPRGERSLECSNAAVMSKFHGRIEFTFLPDVPEAISIPRWLPRLIHVRTGHRIDERWVFVDPLANCQAIFLKLGLGMPLDDVAFATFGRDTELPTQLIARDAILNRKKDGLRIDVIGHHAFAVLIVVPGLLKGGFILPGHSGDSWETLFTRAKAELEPEGQRNWKFEWFVRGRLCPDWPPFNEFMASADAARVIKMTEVGSAAKTNG